MRSSTSGCANALCSPCCGSWCAGYMAVNPPILTSVCRTVEIPDYTVPRFSSRCFLIRRLVSKGGPKSTSHRISLLTLPEVVRSTCARYFQSLTIVCSCVRWTQAIIFFVWLGLFCSRLCWCLRTYALWDRQRWLLMLGLPAIALESAILLGASMKMSYLPIPIGLPQICISSPGAGIWNFLTWVMPLGFDTVMSALSIVRAMRVSRKLRTPLTKQLIQDGYYTISHASLRRFLIILQGSGIMGARCWGNRHLVASLTASQTNDVHLRRGSGPPLGACLAYSG